MNGLWGQSCPFSADSQQVEFTPKAGAGESSGQGCSVASPSSLWCPVLTNPFGVWLITEGKEQQEMALQDMSWIPGVGGGWVLCPCGLEWASLGVLVQAWLNPPGPCWDFLVSLLF